MIPIQGYNPPLFTWHSPNTHASTALNSLLPETKYIFPPVPVSRASVPSEDIRSSYCCDTTRNFRAWMHGKGPSAPGWRLRAGCTPATTAKPQQLELLMSAAGHRLPAHRDWREATTPTPAPPPQPSIPTQSLPSSPDNHWGFPAELSIPLLYRRHNIPSWLAALP